MSITVDTGHEESQQPSTAPGACASAAARYSDASAPPTILHVNKFWGREVGGVETVLKGYVQGLAERHYRQRLLVCRRLGEAPRSLPPGCAGRQLAAPVLASMPLPPGFAAALRQECATADLVHFHLPFPLAVALALRLPKRQPWVATFHADTTSHPAWLQRAHARLVQPFLARLDRIVVGAPALLRSPWLREHAARVEVIPFGYRGVAAEAPPPARPHPPTLLFLGRLVPYKGLDVLLHALAQARPIQPGGVAARLLVIGGGARIRFMRLATRLGVAEQVIFLGHVSEAQLRRALSVADLLVLPSVSRAEAFGLAQLEAMTAGLPVINTCLGTGTDFVSRHGETGLTVAPNDGAALAAAIEQLLNDGWLRQRLGAAARVRALHTFALEKQTQKLDALYRRLLGRAGRAGERDVVVARQAAGA